MQILGSKVVLSIAEPWDFTSSAGQNVLRGVVVRTSELQCAKQWVLCSVTPFVHDGHDLDRVLIVQRYSKERVLDALIRQGECGCNCVFSTKVKVETNGDVKRMLDDGSSPFLAGRACLAS